MNNNESNNKRIYILGGCILLLSAFLLVLYVFGQPFSEKSNNNKKNNSNTNNNVIKDEKKDTLTEISDDEISSLNLKGVYYNSEYQDLYFELKENKKAIIVASTCSNGAAPAVDANYKVSKNKKGDYIVTLYYDQGSDYEADVIEFDYRYMIDNEKVYFISLVDGCAEEEGITEFRTK